MGFDVATAGVTHSMTPCVLFDIVGRNIATMREPGADSHDLLLRCSRSDGKSLTKMAVGKHIAMVSVNDKETLLWKICRLKLP